MQVVLEVGAAGVDCVRLPGWAALGVGALLTAPRLLRDWYGTQDG